MARKKETRRKRAAPAKRKRSKAKKAATARRKSAAAPRRKPAKRRTAARRRTPKRDLLGPPPAEATLMRQDSERELVEQLREHTGTSPGLSGGDLDADWQRAASVGEEAVGGSVATPDQDVVDELGEALGVPRAPDEPFKPSQEILEARDAKRARQEG